MPLLLANIFGWIYAHWRLVGFVLVIVIIVTYFSCRNSGLENELEREKEARSQEGQQRIDDAKENANLAGNVANQSVENANQARNANINSFNGNFSDARRRYCADFPGDCN